MNEDKVILMVIENRERIEIIEKRLKKLDLIDDLVRGQDAMIKILVNIQDEMAAIKHAVSRHETRITRLESFHA